MDPVLLNQAGLEQEAEKASHCLLRARLRIGLTRLQGRSPGYETAAREPLNYACGFGTLALVGWRRAGEANNGFNASNTVAATISFPFAVG